MHPDEAAYASKKRRLRYFPSLLRNLLIFAVLGFLLLGLKYLAYPNYLHGSEFEQDWKIWVALSLVLSFVSPVLELVFVRYRHTWNK
jgi:hypothetical protein